MRYYYKTLRFLGGEPTMVDADIDESPGFEQCPISNHCPMDNARECERYGACYWEEQEQKENPQGDKSLVGFIDDWEDEHGDA